MLRRADTPRPTGGSRGRGLATPMMNDESHTPAQSARQSTQTLSAGLAALLRITFSDSDVGEIFRAATAAVGGLGPCRDEASYRSVDGRFDRLPLSQSVHPASERHRQSNWDGPIDRDGGGWGWA